MSKRERPKGRKAKKLRENRRRKRMPQRFYLTPRAWSHPCGDCKAEHSAAVRPAGQLYLCEDCIKRRGIKVKVAKGYAPAGEVVVTRVDPSQITW